MKNKIGWCNTTWNPIWGCLNNCEYCYARKMAKRFYKKIYSLEFNYYAKNTPSWAWTGDYLQNLMYFKPTFLVSQFEKKFPQKSQRIFVGSMSEIAHWREEWVEKIIEKIKLYPQHIFQFLTRYPGVYSLWVWPENCWLGVTVTNKKELYSIRDVFTYQDRIKFISIEPILGEIDITYMDYLDIDWIILGAETGNRKGKVIPKRKWFEEIVYCQGINKIPVYVKDNLTKYYPEYKGHKQFP